MTETILNGIGTSSGAASGPIFLFSAEEVTIPDRPSQGAKIEQRRFREARQQAQSDLEYLHNKIEKRADDESAAIFEAHITMIDDPALQDMVLEYITEGGTAEKSIAHATAHFVQQFEALNDEYFAARAADVKDIAQRLLRILLDIPMKGFEEMITPSIIVAKDLSPSETANLPPNMTLALVTAAGGLTSHTAILARSLGIPAVVGCGDEVLALAKAHTEIVVNGSDGSLVFSPSEETVKTAHTIQEARQSKLQSLMETAHESVLTLDGTAVHVMANVGNVSDANTAMTYGADGVGLLRTEFLFLSQSTPPDEDKQVSVYQQIFDELGDRPIIIRTLDIGGDKPPSYLDFPEEENPFLGWRAVRYCLDNQDLFLTQLRAILRASNGFDVHIMFPMITNLSELQQAKQLVDKAQRQLAADGIEHATDMPVGMMIETPAAALISDKLAVECDFFSIGTNDLAQYTLATDRTNERIAHLYEPFHPAVLQLIQRTIESAHEANIPVGMCGQMASMQAAIPFLLGMGLHEFSMTASMIPESKALLRKISFSEVKQLADTVVTMSTSQQVEAYMAEYLQKISS